MNAPLHRDLARLHDGSGARKGATVQRIRGFYFYTLGSNIRALRALKAEEKLSDKHYELSVVKGDLEGLLGQTLVPLRSSRQTAQYLYDEVIRLLGFDIATYQFTFYDVYALNNNITNFEVAYNAENSVENMFIVTPKGGYDSYKLIEQGESAFPSDLLVKVPGCKPDARAAGKCIAFELGTAAGFHLFRMLESVVLAYRKSVMPAENSIPSQRNLGAYIRDMEEEKVGTQKIISTLRQIKDLHRNPLVHPEENLTIEEAISLLGIVVSAVSAMLVDLPAVDQAAVLPV